jgi:hypothetical protein
MIPTTTPGQRDMRQAMGMHISECHRGECNGFLGPLDTYLCICWCHERKAARAVTERGGE